MEMRYKQNEIIIATLTVLVVAGIAFYGGLMYQKNYGKINPQNFSHDRQNGNSNRQGGIGGGMMTPGGPNRDGGFFSGEILSKDDKSITVKTRDGGSKIIYFSDTTTVGKTVDGSTSDLNVGIQVMANGKTNTDGSLAADNIQIRPNEPMRQ